MSANKQVLAQIKILASQQECTAAAIEELSKQLVCESCGGKDDVGVRPIMCRAPICQHCFYVWYDHSATDPEYVREQSLARQAAQRRGPSA